MFSSVALDKKTMKKVRCICSHEGCDRALPKEEQGGSGRRYQDHPGCPARVFPRARVSVPILRGELSTRRTARFRAPYMNDHGSRLDGHRQPENPAHKFVNGRARTLTYTVRGAQIDKSFDSCSLLVQCRRIRPSKLKANHRSSSAPARLPRTPLPLRGRRRFLSEDRMAELPTTSMTSFEYLVLRGFRQNL
jgi:hypothetical protein